MTKSPLPFLGCLLLFGQSAWCAPRPKHLPSVKTRVAKNVVTAGAVTQIEIGIDEGGSGGSSRGGTQNWLLRPNGVVQRTTMLGERAAFENGHYAPEVAFSQFERADFAHLTASLQTLGFSALTHPKLEDGEPFVTIRIARGTKSSLLALPDSLPTYSRAAGLRWSALNLVRALTANLRWKNPAGRFLDTGITGAFVRDAAFDKLFEPLNIAQQSALETSELAVLTPAGKEIAHFARQGVGLQFEVILPPGTYRIVPKSAPVAGLSWHGSPETVQVEDGHLSATNVVLQKLP